MSNPPELTAVALAVIFYQDMLVNHTTLEDMKLIRQCILAKIYDPEIRPTIMFRIELFTNVGGNWAGNGIDEDWFFVGLRDIHRTIFDGDDEHLDETIAYFINGANRKLQCVSS